MTTMAAHLAHVCDVYGLEPAGAPLPLRGGYVAYVHCVTGTDGRRVFTKTYDDARPISGMILPTLAALTDATRALESAPLIAGRIIAPLPGPIVRDVPYTTVVFPFVDGITPRETPFTATQLTALVTTVARVHALDSGAAVFADVPKEDFLPSWRDAVVPGLTTAAHTEHALADLIAPRLERLVARYADFCAQAARLRQQEHRMVLCHTDIHGYNVVIRDDLPLLIDWEGLKIAPPEHDLMFWDEDETWPLVRATYTALRPDVPVDPVLLAWYHQRRLFEDLIQDVQRVTHEHPVGAELVDLRDSVAWISEFLVRHE